MKPIILILFTLFFISCSPEKEIDYAIISGVITNADSNKITLINQYNSDDLKDIILDQNGIFTDTIQIQKAGFYSVYENINSIALFLSKGDHIVFTYDAKKLDTTLVFTGSGSITAKYLANKSKVNRKASNNSENLYSLNEKEFIDSIKNVKTELEDLLFNTNNLSESFKENETKNINYQYYYSLSIYESNHQYYTKNNEFNASDAIEKSLNDINLEDENSFEFSQNYRNLVASILSLRAIEISKKDAIEYGVAYFKNINTIENQKIKNKLAFNDAIYGISFAQDLESYYTAYLKTSTNEENNNKIRETYTKIKALAKGSPSPEFIDYENSTGGTISLKDLKGQYIYIDIWATWCGPCIAEVPSLKKLEEKYSGKNIQFISISIDNKEDHEKWKKMIIDKELGGIQLFADNNWGSKFIQDYFIKGIPRFILIDTEGNIVNSNAPRPSDNKLIALLNELKI